MRLLARLSPVLTALLLALLAGCGDASASGLADDQELADRASHIGVAPELIYAVDLSGFEPAWQSVGVYGEAGFSTAYVSPSGDQAMLTVDPRGMTDDSCPDRPIGTADFASRPVECANDGDGWYRTSGDQHEYAMVRDDHVIALSASVDAVDAETIKQAVSDAHPPTASELDELFPPESLGDHEPVERGDLPPNGDGAPINPDGTGREG